MISNKEELENFIHENYEIIDQYLKGEEVSLPIPLYSSVDVRESKSRFAPVDNNLYPAGFNNLCTSDAYMGTAQLKKILPTNIKNIGIFVESHTKNQFYIEHLNALSAMIKAVDQKYEIYWISFELEFQVNEKKIYLATVKDHEVWANQIKIDFIINNNDQSKPMTHVDWNLLKTPIQPTPKIGWFRRQKIRHFEMYHDVVQLFCRKFDIEPKLISADFIGVDHIDFNSKEGLETLALSVEQFLKNLPPDSKVFLKASQGTYGMGIMVVSSANEIRNINRKDRNKMDIGKNNIKFTRVLIQEGVETIVTSNGAPAEITVYLIGGHVIGGFLRINDQKTTLSNLNSRGMIFKKLCQNDMLTFNNEFKRKEKVYTIIARLSTIAAAKEIKEIQETIK